MNNKRFTNIAFVFLVVVLAGVLGYVTLIKKPISTEQSQLNYAQNIDPTQFTTKNNSSLTEPIPVTTISNQELKNLKNCFNVEDALATNNNRSNWENFENLGFAIKYPAESIAVKSIVNKYSGEDVSLEISSVNSPHKATISIYRLQKKNYRMKYMYTPSVSYDYELHSNTWWKDEWNQSKFVQCNPNPRGKTDDGKNFIYSASDGDAGVSLINYFVVLRDTIKTDNYETLIVQFSTGADGNDPNYSSFLAFQYILENIVKTLELRPTSNG